MNFSWLKRSMPRGLYGRAALILVLPIVVLQLAISIVFVQRHFEDVTRQMTTGMAQEVRLVLSVIDAAEDLAAAEMALEPVAAALNLSVAWPDSTGSGSKRRFYDLSGWTVTTTLREAVPEIGLIDLATQDREVRIEVMTRHGPAQITIDRRRASASNPHQLLVIMGLIGVLMTAVAFVYLRNQLRPITRLAAAAEAFGKGRVVTYRPAGAIEVRAAGNAFLDMRNRIERQIEQRTLMLSGVSHDLRTPLTRLKLALSMMEGDEAEALGRDVADMEDMIGAFLDFARADALEEREPVDPAALAERVVDNARRAGGEVTLTPVEGGAAMVSLRPASVERALGNLIGNAIRYGSSATVTVALLDRSVRFTVEDDGPGIPEAERERATRPFTRLDEARNQDRGTGVGLGLSIAIDIARSHGGSLRLGDSAALGGLKAELVLPR